MAADDCAPQLFVCATRIAELDTDGSPLVGGQMVVTDSLAVATLTPVYEEGDEITAKNACGATYVSLLDNPSLKRLDIELDFLSPDPYLHSLALGTDILTDGTAKGFAYPAIGQVTGDGVSIELWTQRIIGGALSTVHPYAQWALPRVRSLRIGARTFGGSEQHSLITGQANENPNWDDGPANDFPVASTRVAQMIPVDDLPTIACGFSTVPAS